VFDTVAPEPKRKFEFKHPRSQFVFDTREGCGGGILMVMRDVSPEEQEQERNDRTEPRQRPLLNALFGYIHEAIFKTERKAERARRDAEIVEEREAARARRDARIITAEALEREIDARVRENLEQYRFRSPWLDTPDPNIGLERLRRMYREIINITHLNVLYGTQLPPFPPPIKTRKWDRMMTKANTIYERHIKRDLSRGVFHDPNEERLQVFRTANEDIEAAVNGYFFNMNDAFPPL
jgi:hypothetical protein